MARSTCTLTTFGTPPPQKKTNPKNEMTTPSVMVAVQNEEAGFSSRLTSFERISVGG